MTGRAILTFAKLYVGLKYILGIVVPKNDKDYKGGFDCAEFVAYCIYQVYGLLFGCDTADPKKAATADAYTGYFNRDVVARKLIEIPVAQGIRTPGAFLLRLAVGKSLGHIVISQGNGKTYEAHSTAEGLDEFPTDGRRFDKAFLIPGVNYRENAPVISSAPAIVFRLKRPFMKDVFINRIQEALKEAGYDPKGTDSIYGEDTQAAVVAYQKAYGLTPDGEIMPGGPTARSLNVV